MNSRFKQICSTHKQVGSLNMKSLSYRQEVFEIFFSAFNFDVGGGDLTSKFFVPSTQKAKANFIFKQPGIVHGLNELDFIFKNEKSLADLTLKIFKKNGDQVKSGEIIASIFGNARDVLKIERTALNFLQRLCGIATLSKQYVDLVPASILITPTRKTFWGKLDKAACISGGAGSHRINLSDAILVKDNHLKLLDWDFEKIFKKLIFQKKIGIFFEIEIGNFIDFKIICDLYKKYIKDESPFYILLDNIKPAELIKFVNYLHQSKLANIFLEASGGINRKNIKKYAKTGVDIISIGALTHSAPALDISMKIV